MVGERGKSVKLIKTSDFVQSPSGVDILFEGKADCPDGVEVGLERGSIGVHTTFIALGGRKTDKTSP